MQGHWNLFKLKPNQDGFIPEVVLPEWLKIYEIYAHDIKKKFVAYIRYILFSRNCQLFINLIENNHLDELTLHEKWTNKLKDLSVKCVKIDHKIYVDLPVKTEKIHL